MVTNTLGVYDPIFYAQEALIQLENALGMASRIHMGFSEERGAFGRGSVVNIRKPATFTVGNAPATAQDTTTETVAITLDQWREVKFALTDKELAFTRERIINDHIRPAAVALADDVDVKLNALADDIPWLHQMTTTAASVSTLTNTWQTLFDNKVPMTPGMVHLEANGILTNEFLQLAAFSQQQGAGDFGVNTQRTGSLGMKYGLEPFANQNVQQHAYPSTALGGTPLLNGAVVKGATSIVIDGAAASGEIKKGDSFVLAGNTQRYVATADVTMSSGAGTVAIFPALVANYADNTALTIAQNSGNAVYQNLAFHRNAFAIVTAPLSEMGNELGAKIATVSDPITGLSIRSRLYYMPDISEVRVALDLLFGVKTLDANLAVRVEDDV